MSVLLKVAKIDVNCSGVKSSILLTCFDNTPKHFSTPLQLTSSFLIIEIISAFFAALTKSVKFLAKLKSIFPDEFLSKLDLSGYIQNKILEINKNVKEQKVINFEPIKDSKLPF